MKKIIEVIKNNKLATLMSFITFLIGCIPAIDSIGMPLKGRLITLLLSFLPCIIYIILIVVQNHFSNVDTVKRSTNAIAIVLSCFLFLYYFVSLFMYGLISFMNPVTDIKYYKSKVFDGKILQVFPKEIPDNVKETDFLYSPGFLQAGTVLRLYYKDDSLTKEEFEKKYKDKAIWIGYEKEYSENKGLFSDIYYNTPAYETKDDFLIYLIEAYCDDSGYCNHGYFLLASHNDKTNEVMYILEDW